MTPNKNLAIMAYMNKTENKTKPLPTSILDVLPWLDLRVQIARSNKRDILADWAN